MGKQDDKTLDVKIEETTACLIAVARFSRLATIESRAFDYTLICFD